MNQTVHIGIRGAKLLADALAKAEEISPSEHKLVTGWYGQRTDAAHKRWENVIRGEVERMIPGVREFIVRHPP